MITLLTKIKHYWLILTLIFLAIITVLSLSPAQQLPSAPGSDKTHHFIAYATLMFPLAFRKPSRWMLIALFFVGFSGAIELIQPYVNRYGEWLDLLANIAGLFIGYLIANIVNRLFLSNKNQA